MKNFYLLTKSLLVAALLCLGTNAWAQATTVYERGVSTAWSANDAAASGTGEGVWYGNFGYDATYGLYASGKGSREAVMTFTHTNNSIQIIDIVYNNLGNTGDSNNYSYIKIGNAIEIQSNQQAQTGTVIINGNSSSISDCNKKNYNRGGDSWTIHVEINTAKNNVTALTIVGTEMNGKHASYTLAGETPLGTSPAYNTVTVGVNRVAGSVSTAVTSIKITEEEQAVVTADYKVNYIYNGTPIRTDAGKTSVDAIVSAESSFWIDEVKYVLEGEQTTSMTIVEGTNILNVNVKECDTYAWTVKSSTGITLKSGNNYADESITTAYPEFCLDGATLYQMEKYDDSKKQYNVTFTLDTDNKEVIINSSQIATNAIYYREGEDITGMSKCSGNNIGVRCSDSDAGTTQEALTITTLPAGKYIISVGLYENSSNNYHTATFTVGSYELSHTCTAVNQNAKTFEEITLTEATDVIYSGTTNPKNGLDYIYITQSSVPVTISAAGYATFSSTYALDFTNAGVEAYIATGGDANTVTMEKVEGTVAANTGLVLKGAEGSYNIPVVASGTDYSDTNKLWAITSGETVTKAADANYTNYVLAKQNGKVVFAPVTGENTVEVPAGRAALSLYTGAGNTAREVRMVFDGVTGIDAVQGSEFMVNGSLQDGKFIENGKLVIKKNGKKFNANGAQVK